MDGISFRGNRQMQTMTHRQICLCVLTVFAAARAPAVLEAIEFPGRRPGLS
jgi:hypothetical protein